MFSLTFTSQSNARIGKVDNIKMKSLAEIPNFRLPPISKVLRITPMVVSPKIEMQFNSPIPTTCLEMYLDAIDMKLASTGPQVGPGCSRPLSPGPMGGIDSDMTKKLKEVGCQCHNSRFVNVTSTDKKTVSKHKDVLGKYELNGAMFNNKVYYAKKVPQTATKPAKTYMLFWADSIKAWMISDMLTNDKKKAILKMEDNALGLECPSNPSTKFWTRKGLVGWSKDKTMAVKCLSEQSQRPPLVQPTPSPMGGSTSSLLLEHGCKCANTKLVNLSSTDSRVLSKHRLELGAYKFENKLQDGKPYYVKRNLTNTYYLFWKQSAKSWWIANSLTSTKPLLRMQKNVDTSCPENPTTKKWERKNAIGVWGSDKSMKLTCEESATRPSSRRPSSVIDPSTSGKSGPTILREHGCKCASQMLVNISSTDSRVLSKHRLELGAYKFENKLQDGKPYYVKRNLTNTYYLFWKQSAKSWWIANSLTSTKPLLRMQKNVDTSCPENPTTKKWERKNAIGVWGSDKSMKLTCEESSRPGYPTPGGTSRPTTEMAKKDMLKRAGCKCHTVTSIQVSSRDSRTLKKHKNELGQYKFEGELHEGAPVYAKRDGANVFYMYFNKKKKAWWIGKTVGSSSPLMKTDDSTDQVCPADPTTPKSKSWERKNMFGIWSKDSTMAIKCL